MILSDSGYTTYFDKECTFVREGMRMFLVSTKENENLSKHFNEKNYHLQLRTAIFNNCTAYVEQQLLSDLNNVFVELKYFIKRIDDIEINSIEMIANEIEEFFSPLDFYFRLKRSNKYVSSDLLYDCQIIKSYSFIYKNHKIIADVLYGGILSDGVRSDLFVHPILSLKFDKTSDTDFLFELYEIVIKLLQFAHRKQSYNIKRIDLYSNRNGSKSYSGNMLCSEYNNEVRSKSRIEASFMYYGDQLSNILDIIASEKDTFPISHLDYSYSNYYNYTPRRAAALFSAFEYEYKKNNEYPQKSMEDAQELKDKVISYIKSINEENELTAEFKKIAKNKISDIGGSPGFTRKIKEAYKRNDGVFIHSRQSLFLRNGDLRASADRLNRIRQTIVHDDIELKFDDYDIECLRFLEVLQFVMTLKRAKYDNQEIEELIGIIYGCNSVYLQNLIIGDEE